MNAAQQAHAASATPAPDVAPPLHPAHVIRSGTEALERARDVAHVFAKEASHRDRERRLPWDEIAYFTASGLGGITVPAEDGGADVSMQVLSEVFRILCAADPHPGSSADQFGVLNVVRAFATHAQKQPIYGAVLAGHRLGNTGPEPEVLFDRRTLCAPCAGQDHR